MALRILMLASFLAVAFGLPIQEVAAEICAPRKDIGSNVDVQDPARQNKCLTNEARCFEETGMPCPTHFNEPQIINKNQPGKPAHAIE